VDPFLKGRPTYRLTCRFVLTSSSRDPAEVTRILGQPPDKSWRLGEPRSKSTLVHDHSAWILVQCSPESASVGDQLAALIDRVRPLLVEGVPEGWEAQVSCEILSHGEFPSMTLAPGILRFLADVGASLDVDLM